jgi:hypothetical protein
MEQLPGFFEVGAAAAVVPPPDGPGSSSVVVVSAGVSCSGRIPDGACGKPISVVAVSAAGLDGHTLPRSTIDSVLKGTGSPD